MPGRLDPYLYPEPLRPRLVRSEHDSSALRELLDRGWFKAKDDAKALAEVLDLLEEKGWTSRGREELLKSLADAAAEGRMNPEAIAADSNRRLLDVSDADDCFAVLECLATTPPAQMEILHLLSESGHEKLAFLARSSTHLGPIVLKRFRTPEGLTDADVEGEITARSHPNIVSTEYFQNAAGEHFFTEEYMDEVLGDDTVLYGYVEPANLLFEMSSALAYLHLVLQRIHGDVKPDNIARHEGRYVLLDFGNSVRVSDPTPVPSGSFRTRAPELLSGAKEFTSPPEAADVWSLGATLYFLLVGRYPLFQQGEDTPDTSRPTTRDAFRRKLQRRASEEYERYVDFEEEGIQAALKPLLRGMLEREPDNRPRARELTVEAERALAPYLRADVAASAMRPAQEFGILERHLKDALGHDVPRGWVKRCRGQLVRMRGLPDWGDPEFQAIDDLIRRIDHHLSHRRP